jgi:catechol 2,3-dioxygenase-like lactoylglutathione lyase family enzyme
MGGPDERLPIDERPPVWVGHVTLTTDEIPKNHDFLLRLGMRPIQQGEDFAVLELRGGTHLVLIRSDDATPGPAGFDLMVEDIETTRERLRAAQIEMSEIAEGKIHRSFSVTSPSGHTIQFNSSHVSDRPV